MLLELRQAARLQSLDMAAGMMAFSFSTRLFVGALVMVEAVSHAGVCDAAPAVKQTGKPMWDLSDLYSSADFWSAEYARVKGEVQRLENHRGTLATSAAAMLDALKAVSAANKGAGRLFTYAGLKADEDLTNAVNQERKQQAGAMMTLIAENTAWLSPETVTASRSNGRPSIHLVRPR